MVAAQAAAASATSSSVKRASPSGLDLATTDWKRKKSWCWRSVSPDMDGSSAATSTSCCRRTTAAGCSRDAARWGQSDGQSISTRRFVPQQTGQITRPSAGQLRLAFRVWQRGQATRKLYTPPPLGQSPGNPRPPCASQRSVECRKIINLEKYLQHLMLGRMLLSRPVTDAKLSLHRRRASFGWPRLPVI